MQLKVFESGHSILLTMKLLILLTVVGCLQVSAGGFGQTITLSLSNAPLETAFKEIKKQSGYSFIYTRAQLKATIPVTCELRSITLTEALAACFKDQPLTFIVEDRYIVVQTKAEPIPPATTSFQPINITGRVVNESGEPIEGATLMIKGTQRGAMTDANGYFEIKDIDQNAVLIISGVNIESLELKVGDKSKILIQVKTKITAQQEVTINAGYYNTTDKLRTGNISKVTAETISKQPVNNPLQALQGRVAGLYISQNTGVPGGDFTVQNSG